MNTLGGPGWTAGTVVIELGSLGTMWIIKKQSSPCQVAAPDHPKERGLS